MHTSMHASVGFMRTCIHTYAITLMRTSIYNQPIIVKIKNIFQAVSLADKCHANLHSVRSQKDVRYCDSYKQHLDLENNANEFNSSTYIAGKVILGASSPDTSDQNSRSVEPTISFSEISLRLAKLKCSDSMLNDDVGTVMRLTERSPDDVNAKMRAIERGSQDDRDTSFRYSCCLVNNLDV